MLLMRSNVTLLEKIKGFWRCDFLVGAVSKASDFVFDVSDSHINPTLNTFNELCTNVSVTSSLPPFSSFQL